MFTAFDNFLRETAESLVRYCLLVLGGFLLGYMGGWASGAGVNRYAFKGKAPADLQKLLRLAGGLVVAVLIAILLFPHWGNGPGPGGPNGNGTGEANSAAQNPGDATVEPKDVPKEKPPEPKKLIEGSTEMPITIRLLGGNNAEGKNGENAYQIADDPTGKKHTLPDLTKVLLQKKKEADEKKIKMRVLIERPGIEGEDRVPLTSSTWILLERWLTEQKIPPFDR